MAHEEHLADLSIRPEKTYYIIEKAREFDAKVAPGALDPGSNPGDDQQRIILEDRAHDPTYLALVGALDDLNEDEGTELVALAWLGRGDYVPDEWPQALITARERRSPDGVGRYLVGIPLLADYLEEGMSQLGYSGEEFEIGRF